MYQSRRRSFVSASAENNECGVPVSEKKVLKPWSGSAALRSSVRKPSGWKKNEDVSMSNVAFSMGCRLVTLIPCSRQ